MVLISFFGVECWHYELASFEILYRKPNFSACSWKLTFTVKIWLEINLERL